MSHEVSPTMSFTANRHDQPVSWIRALSDIGLCAAAGGMGWGIRGQYGHETGAMLAGVLVGLIVLLRFTPHVGSLAGARAAAMFAVAIGVGGSMTYGQTIGLTQDPKLIGNWSALLWGMLGLGIKGGLWIGIAALLLGAGLSGTRYRWWEWLLVLSALMGLHALGVMMLNRPFDPANRQLPWIYFSSDWRWASEEEWKPRPEVWGGYLLSFVGLIVYLGGVRRDRFAWKLGMWGAAGGFIGFPLGQCLQAFYGWNREWCRTMTWTANINWWNMMEITFGAVMAAFIAIGLTLHRSDIRPIESDRNASPGSIAWEYGLLALHAGLLITAEFTPEIPWLSRLYEDGIPLLFIPLVLASSGRIASYYLLLPIVLVPVAGKTIRHLGYQEPQLSVPIAWLIYGVVPVATMVAMAYYSSRRGEDETAGKFASRGSLTATWIYFALNFGFFRFPLPWNEWTARTPSNLIFLACALALTAACFKSRWDCATEATES